MSICSAGAPAKEHKDSGPHCTPPDDTDKLGFSIKEAAQASGLSRSLLYLAIGEGQLRARKCRGRTIILREDLHAFLTSLPHVKIAT
jgi:excisionase family DNA binding protein